MITFPRAKINLGLHVTAKRRDGYHDIETLFYPVGLTDALEFVINDSGSVADDIVMTGLDIVIRQKNNIVLKAVSRLRKEYKIPYLRIHLHKAIPAGAGLGGGSSDASYFLKVLNRYFQLGLSNDQLRSVALEMGSDCPFFIDALPAVATGRGEILKPLDCFLNGYSVSILNPGVSIITKEAYCNCRPAKPKVAIENIISRHPGEWKKLLKNDFEEYAFKVYPLIGDLKEGLYRAGALFSLMSGSGSSVYAIWEGNPQVPAWMKKYSIFEGAL
jgi:4-diphosphocytidyl-2-C-methyl-D-erythritol kinase